MNSYRILFLTSSLRSGGAENHLLNLCRFIISRGHEAAVCTISPIEDGLESHLLVEGVELNRVPLSSLKGFFLPGTLASLRRIVNRVEPDLLHAHLFYGEVLGWIVSRFTDAPLITTRHSSGLEFEGWRRIAAKMMRRRFEAVIAVSDEVERESRSLGYRDDVIQLIPNAIDTTRFRPLEGEERRKRRAELLGRFFPDAAEDTPIVGSAGRLKRVKNFPLLVKLAARFMEWEGPGPAPRFLVFGDGPERQNLSRLIDEAGAGERIALAGHADRMEDLYPLLDIFLLVSKSEGTPLALLEAMACRVACVASDVGGVGAAVEDAGMTVRPGDEEGFASAVRALVVDQQRRSELARRARVRILERYDMDAWGERILKVYHSLLEQS